jgi:hypothetical protein
MGEANRDLLVPEEAERRKDLAGGPYRPANGTEGQLFMERYCYQCRKDDGGRPDGDSCEILCNALAFDPDDPEYPAEWQYTDRGQPTCTAFEAREETNG